MAQGTRGRLLLVAATGFGVVLCTGLVGCQNTDKSKDTKVVAKQPTPLPGTTQLPPPGTSTAATKAVTPTQPYGAPGAVGATGTTGTPGTFSTTSTSGMSGTGAPSVLPPGGSMPAAMGLGAGSGTGIGAGLPQYSSTSNGSNSLTSPPQQPNFGPATPGYRGGINAPVQPGIYTPPSGGGTSAAPNPGSALGAAANMPSPPVVALLPMELPGPVPPAAPPSGSAGNSVATAPVQPPVAPLAPPIPATIAGGTAAGKPVNYNSGVFGPQ